MELRMHASDIRRYSNYEIFSENHDSIISQPLPESMEEVVRGPNIRVQFKHRQLILMNTSRNRMALGLDLCGPELGYRTYAHAFCYWESKACHRVGLHARIIRIIDWLIVIEKLSIWDSGCCSYKTNKTCPRTHRPWERNQSHYNVMWLDWAFKHEPNRTQQTSRSAPLVE